MTELEIRMEAGCLGSKEIREWLASPYLEEGGKLFLVKLYTHTKDITEREAAMGEMLGAIALWLKYAVIGASRSS